MEVNKELVAQNGSQSGAVLGELTGDELLAQNGNQAGSAMGELTDDELLAQNGNQAGVGVAEYFDELDKRPKCLTFTAGEGGAIVGFIVNSAYEQLPETYTKPLLQYSTDGGETWQDYDLRISDSDDIRDATPVEIAEGKSVMFKGVNENLAYYFESEDDWLYVQARIGGSVAASGDVTSLLNGEGGDVVVPQNCFASMFAGCKGLTQAPALPATTLASDCYNSMFAGCKITSYDVATLNDSPNVFADNSSCTSLTIHADTPPTIGRDTIAGLKDDCVIYVPAASVDAYRNAQHWSARALYIQAIP